MCLNGFGDIAKVKAADFEVIEEATEEAYETETMLETTYSYDSFGNLAKVKMADGSEISYTYDFRGNVLTQKDGNGNVTTYEYYPFGRVKSKTDAEGNTESYVYDVFGNLIEKTDANGVVISYEYDERNNLTSVTDGGSINVGYGYDNNNNRTSMNDATGSYTYTYNARGQVTRVKYGSADYITYTYDNAGNVTNYSNLFLSETIGYEYDKNNRIVKMGDEEYKYDNNGNVVELNNGAGLWVTYTYDKNNRVTEMMNQPLNLFSVTDTTYPTFTYEYEYYANGYEKSKTDFNGTVNYTYDNAGRISTVTDSATGATRQYTYDNAGNRTGLSETFSADKTGNTTFMGSEIGYTAKTTSYAYSPTNELVTAHENYSVTGGNVEKITHYEYDKVGNEISQRVNCATSDEISFGITDNNDWGVIDYCIEYTINEYDALNRLVYVNSVKNSNSDEATYTYNGDGLRVSSTVKGMSNSYQNEARFYHYNGSKLMNITRNSLQSSAGKISYIPSLTGYTGFVENGETLVYTKNAHGDVNATVNATGNVVDLYVYDEFGNVDYLQKNTDNRILYAGEYLDTETGNYYLKARYYNPYTGRFTQRDPHWTPSNMIYGDVTESTPAPDVRSSDYAVYVPTPIERKAMVLPTDNSKDDKVKDIILETMAFSESATYNGSLYDSYFASFGTSEEALFAAIIARRADNGAILQSANLYVYCTNNPVMYVDKSGEILVSAYRWYVGAIDGANKKASVTLYTYSAAIWGYAPEYSVKMTLTQDREVVAEKTTFGNDALPVTLTADTKGRTSYWSATVEISCNGETFKWVTKSVLLNKMGRRFPGEYTDPKSKKTMVEPSSLNWVKVDNPVSWTTHDREKYRRWYEETYNNGKEMDWSDLEIHHIRPRAYGGTNDYSNLIVLPKKIHKEYTSWWAGY